MIIVVIFNGIAVESGEAALGDNRSGKLNEDPQIMVQDFNK